jgi:adenine-specific DNA-methyltransferase
LARSSSKKKPSAEYKHADEAVLRPDVGTQAQFMKKKPAKKYRYDDSLAPAMDWDSQNPARELGEWLLAQIQDAAGLDAPHEFDSPRSFGDIEVRGLRDAVDRLRALGVPFLDWSGKAERLSFDVPTLPLFVHERLSTKAILETLKGHERDQQMELQLFADPQLPLHQQLEAYEHKGGWVNRMILGDSLVVMNSLLEYEGLGGQVQTIYIDPPYGVKFGSNFQPFVRKRDVRNNDDKDMTREPEMVKAYRDTWELGLHSYLTYLRDRLLVARELLTDSGSVFVQISDENVHHVRELMDEVFGPENFCSVITFQKTASLGGQGLGGVADFLLWYARDRSALKVRKLFRPRGLADDVGNRYTRIELPDGTRRVMTRDERLDPDKIPAGARVYRHDNLTSQRPAGEGDLRAYEFDGIRFTPGRGTFKTDLAGLKRLENAKRLAYPTPNSLVYIRYLDDFAFAEQTNLWTDTQTGAFSEEKLYVVQTNVKVIQRCILMTSDPGDLVLDPTCGSGTTAYVAEQWGRRWITADTSRVPLALARQRLLTATFPYYQLQDPARGPGAGFVYKRRPNSKGEEVGGIVPHVTLKSIANDEPPAEEVLVDRPETDNNVTRVSGPFVVEATIPTPADIHVDGEEDSGVPEDGSYVDRMLEALRRSPVVQLEGNQSIALKHVRAPGQSLTLSAEAQLERGDATAAIVFGPENGAVSEKLVFQAAREANLKGFSRLLVIGFAIEPNARTLVDQMDAQAGIPASYVQATPDLVMGELLKTMRSSQLFSVTGLPDVALRKVAPEENGGPQLYEVALRGLDTFDPTTFEATHRKGDDVPAWFLDTNWNGLSFHVSQAFFPRTSAWDSLKKALHTDFEESVWDHLAGTDSAPFAAGEHREVAVKVIDDRGNELLVTKSLDEAT